MIPIQREPPSMAMEWERCCFCRAGTPWWTALKSRLPGGQVACCRACAAGHKAVQVPSKRAWCDLEDVRRWAKGHAYPWERDMSKYLRATRRLGQRPTAA